MPVSNEGRSASVTLLERIQDDVKQAMKAQDFSRTTSLRMFVAALQDRAKTLQRPLTESEEVEVLARERKRRGEAVDAYEAGGAPERAEAERQQIVLVDQYLPQRLSADQINTLVVNAIADIGATSPKQMGLVMKALKPHISGRADARTVSERVRAALGQVDHG